MKFNYNKNDIPPTEQELYERYKTRLLIILGIIIAVFSITFIWVALFKAVIDKPDIEYIVYTISVLGCIPISAIYSYRKCSMSFGEDVYKFYIFNCVLTYIILNIESLFIGGFGIPSLLGGAFIVALLSVIPTLIIVPIIITIKKRR